MLTNCRSNFELNYLERNACYVQVANTAHAYSKTNMFVTKCLEFFSPVLCNIWKMTIEEC